MKLCKIFKVVGWLQLAMPEIHISLTSAGTALMTGGIPVLPNSIVKFFKQLDAILQIKVRASLLWTFAFINNAINRLF